MTMLYKFVLLILFITSFSGYGTLLKLGIYALEFVHLLQMLTRI
jgi:hypothetical protein